MGGTERGRCPKCGHEKLEASTRTKAEDYVICVRCRHRFKAKAAFTHVLKRAQRTLDRKVDEVNRKLGKLL